MHYGVVIQTTVHFESSFNDAIFDLILTNLCKIKSYRVWNVLESWLPSALFCFFISVSAAWWSVYEFDTDEGIALGKAMLVANGFHPYSEIWNDQPPLLTYSVASVENFFPGSVVAARALVLVCAGFLLRSLFCIVRRQNGPLAGWMAVLLLATFSLYGTLSVSVMPGLPAVALLVVGFDAVSGGSKSIWARILFGGVLFGLSLQVKLFTIVAAPAICLALFLAESHRSYLMRFGTIAALVFVSLATYVFVVWIIDVPVASQVWAPHFTDELRSGHSLSESFDRISRYLSGDQPLLLFGLAGAVSLLFGAWRRGVVPLIWFGAAFAALLLHSPVWRHHTLLLAVPLAWLGGVFAYQLGAFLDVTPTRQRFVFAIPLFFVFLAYPSFRAPGRMHDKTDFAAVEALKQNAGSNAGWVFSDRPMDAFRAGLLVPPEVVVFSGKRQSAGNLSTSDILYSLKLRRPKQVLLRRFSINPAVREFLEKNYRKVPNTHAFEHFILSNASDS